MRNYKRKTNRGLTSIDVMQQAAALVRNGKSMRQSALQFGICHASLRRYIMRIQKNDPAQWRPLVGFYGTRQVFNPEQEAILISYIEKCSAIYFGLTPPDVRSLAYRSGKQQGVKMPSQWTKNGMAGADWFANFLKRHPSVPIRTPETTSAARASCYNRSNVANYFQKLGAVLEHYKFKTSDIWNVDETVINILMRTPETDAKKQTPQTSAATANDQKTSVTMTLAVCADGNSIPPMFIFPHELFDTHLIQNGPDDCISVGNASGLSTDIDFQLFLQHFISHVRPCKTTPILLLLDNHHSHLAPAILNLAEDNGIVLLSFAAYCSHRLQPLERILLGSLREHVYTAMDGWMRNNPEKEMSVFDIPAFVRRALPLVMTPDNVQYGFARCGIAPFDPDAFYKLEFAAASFTNERIPQFRCQDPDVKNSCKSKVATETASFDIENMISSTIAAPNFLLEFLRPLPKPKELPGQTEMQTAPLIGGSVEEVRRISGMDDELKIKKETEEILSPSGGPLSPFEFTEGFACVSVKAEYSNDASSHKQNEPATDNECMEMNSNPSQGLVAQPEENTQKRTNDWSLLGVEEHFLTAFRSSSLGFSPGTQKQNPKRIKEEQTAGFYLQGNWVGPDQNERCGKVVPAQSERITSSPNTCESSSQRFGQEMQEQNRKTMNKEQNAELYIQKKWEGSVQNDECEKMATRGNEQTTLSPNVVVGNSESSSQQGIQKQNSKTMTKERNTGFYVRENWKGSVQNEECEKMVTPENELITSNPNAVVGNCERSSQEFQQRLQKQNSKTAKEQNTGYYLQEKWEELVQDESCGKVLLPENEQRTSNTAFMGNCSQGFQQVTQNQNPKTITKEQNKRFYLQEKWEGLVQNEETGKKLVPPESERITSCLSTVVGNCDSSSPDFQQEVQKQNPKVMTKERTTAFYVRGDWEGSIQNEECGMVLSSGTEQKTVVGNCESSSQEFHQEVEKQNPKTMKKEQSPGFYLQENWEGLVQNGRSGKKMLPLETEQINSNLNTVIDICERSSHEFQQEMQRLNPKMMAKEQNTVFYARGNWEGSIQNEGHEKVVPPESEQTSSNPNTIAVNCDSSSQGFQQGIQQQIPNATKQEQSAGFSLEGNWDRSVQNEECAWMVMPRIERSSNPNTCADNSASSSQEFQREIQDQYPKKTREEQTAGFQGNWEGSVQIAGYGKTVPQKDAWVTSSPDTVLGTCEQTGARNKNVSNAQADRCISSVKQESASERSNQSSELDSDAFVGETYEPMKQLRKKFSQQDAKTEEKKAKKRQQYRNRKGKRLKIFKDYHCRCNCHEKVNVHERKYEFKKFIALGSHEAQTGLICGLVSEKPVKRRRKKASNKRNFTRVYRLAGKEVCKNMFLQTLQISSCKVHTAMTKLKSVNMDFLLEEESEDDINDDSILEQTCKVEVIMTSE